MPMNEPNGAHMVDPALLGSVEVEEVLYEAETPVLYTTKTASGQPLLAYTAEESTDATWLVFTACTPRTIADLKSGRLAVREALTSSWMWLAQRTPAPARELPLELPLWVGRSTQSACFRQCDHRELDSCGKGWMCITVVRDSTGGADPKHLALYIEASVIFMALP